MRAEPHGTVVGYHSGMLDIPLDAVVDRENFDSCRRARSRRARRTPSNPGWRTRLFVLAVMTFVAAAPGQAQETGTVRGTVTLAENGGPVDGAVILILGTGAFTFTENGAFEFTNVPVGSYLVTAQRERLTAGSQTVAVNAGETVAADFELSLAPVREEITVTAPAGRRRGDAADVQHGHHGQLVRDSQAGAEHHRRSPRARAGHRQPQLRARREPAGHPGLRGRPGADHRGRDPHRRPLRHVGSPRDDHRPEQRRADRDRAGAGHAAVRLQRRRGTDQHHHPARGLPQPADPAPELRRYADRRNARAARNRRRECERPGRHICQRPALAGQDALLGQRRQTPDGRLRHPGRSRLQLGDRSHECAHRARLLRRPGLRPVKAVSPAEC